MLNIKPRYLVDEAGRKTGAVLSLKEYRRLMQRLEDLEDALDLARAIRCFSLKPRELALLSDQGADVLLCGQRSRYSGTYQAASPTVTLTRLPNRRRARSIVAALVAWSGFSMRRTSLSAISRSRARRRCDTLALRNAS